MDEQEEGKTVRDMILEWGDDYERLLDEAKRSVAEESEPNARVVAPPNVGEPVVVRVVPLADLRLCKARTSRYPLPRGDKQQAGEEEMPREAGNAAREGEQDAPRAPRKSRPGGRRRLAFARARRGRTIDSIPPHIVSETIPDDLSEWR